MEGHQFQENGEQLVRKSPLPACGGIMLLLRRGYFGAAVVGGLQMAQFASRIVLAAAFFVTASAVPSRAQTPAINDLKGKIFDAKMAQQTFAGGLKHCSELNGSNFYFQQRDRILNLDDYHRSLDSLAAQHVFNPETKRPWDQKDADARWQQVQLEAAKNKADCALVASLPDLQKQLDALQQQAAASQSGNPPANK
jgi:hypothetical protein